MTLPLALALLTAPASPPHASPVPPPRVAYDWRPVSIVAGGFVSGIVAHPTARDVVYARTDIGGAYRLDPKTRAWIPLQDWLTKSEWNLYGIESIGLDPSNPDRVYLAAGTYTNEWGTNGAILRSTDRGETWKTTPLPFKNGGNELGRSIGERLAVDPQDGRIVLFGTREHGLWRSADAGATWTKVAGFPVADDPSTGDWRNGGRAGLGVGWVLFGPKGTDRVIAAPAVPGTPLYESRDRGATWIPIAGSPPMIPHHGAIAPDGTLVVTYGNGPGPNDVTDGAVWTLAPNGAWTDVTPLKPTKEKGFGYAGLSLDARHPGTMIVSTLDRWGADTLFRTTNGGKTWTSLAERSTRDASASPYLKWDKPEADFGHWIGDCEIDPSNPDRAWYVTGATIWETTELTRADRGEPTRWHVAGRGIEETAVLDLVSPPQGAHVLSALGDIGGFPHFDLDRAYAPGMLRNPLLVTTDAIDFAETKPNLVVRTGRAHGDTRHGGVSEDGGRTWTPLATDPPGGGNGGPSAISADGTTILWSPGDAPTVRTLDRGRTWLPCAGLPNGVRPIADRVNPRRFFAQDRRTGRFWASGDAGVSFAPGASFTSGPGESGKARAVFGREGHLWAPMPGGLFRTIDGGRTFTNVRGVDSALAVGLGKAEGAGYPTVFLIGRIGGVEGVFRSTDEGRTWAQVNDARTGFGTMEVVTGDPKVFGRFYVGTNGRGIQVADPRKSTR